MNLYFLVEGDRTEKKVYRSWIKHVFPDLNQVQRIDDIHSNHFFLLAGGGYPSYRKRIAAALEDIAKFGTIDHFFICIDTEERTVKSKLSEIQGLLADGPVFSNSHIIVHHCCIETWFLGNSRMLRPNPQREELRKYKQFYDVRENDPEEMHTHPKFVIRAQFHEAYLKEIFREQGLSYNKSKPKEVIERYYFDALTARHEQTGHINSFGKLIQVWKMIGGNC